MESRLKIKNVEFLICLNKLNLHIDVYRELEKLVYGNKPLDQINKFKIILKERGSNYLISLIEKNVLKQKTINLKQDQKRKNIKESMIENYVIKNNKGKSFLKKLNLQFFLKNIPNKYIKIKNGDIEEISDYNNNRK